MERRKFFQLLGLGAGAAALGGKAVAATIISNKEKTDAVKKIEENSGHGYGEVTIVRDYGKERNYDFFIDSSGNVRDIAKPSQAGKTSEVSMTPGPDGELYLKLNGKWRKIVTE
mgnify:CR=1 FL=1